LRTADEMMSAKVAWANRAGYRILTRDIPSSLAPYNALIRVNEKGTEDRELDYLAVFSE
jgi:hypothetical protein